VAELVPALAGEGIEVHVITPRLKGGETFEQPDENIYVHRIEPPAVDLNDFFSVAWQTNLRLQEEAYRIVDNYRGRGKTFDLIHVHDWLVAFTGSALKQHYKIPLVATIHATERGRGRGYLPGDLPRAINNVEWWLTYEAWRIICCSNYMRSEVQEYFETPSDKIDIVYNGISTAHFDVLDGIDLDDFRTNYAAPDEKIVFFVGRMVDEKGARILVDSAPRILSSNDKVKFVLAGTGPQLQEYKDLANSMGLGQRFYFTGYVPDSVLHKLYRIADVAAFPSLYEPFGIVALEAMAAKTPVVVSDTGGLSEVVDNHETGLKVFPNDPASLAWGIMHTLAHPTWSEARAENAYKIVSKFYNWPLIAEETIEVYLRVIEEYRNSEWGGMAK
jgi:glycosyltransferase involved in cell wall biosynthesis